MRIQNLIDAVRYGLFTQRVLQRLRGAGLEIGLYQWVAEGESDAGDALSATDADLRIALLDESHVDEVAGDRSWITREQLLERVRKGHYWIGVFVGDRIAAYMWADPVECSHPPNRAPLSPGEVYLYDAYSRPQYRGRDIAPLMRRGSYRLLRDRGFTRFYSITDYFNSSAARFKQKLGARPLCLYLFIKLGSRPLRNWKVKTYGATP